MWILLADRGVFSTLAGRIGVIASIPTHYAVGILLLVAIRVSVRSAASSAPAFDRIPVRA
jgi:hypothetical protein